MFSLETAINTAQWSPSNQDEHTGRGLVDDYTRASLTVNNSPEYQPYVHDEHLYMRETTIPYRVVECLSSGDMFALQLHNKKS